MRILVVEDERSLAELVADRLKKERYVVDISYDGEDGLYNALRCFRKSDRKVSHPRSLC